MMILGGQNTSFEIPSGKASDFKIQVGSNLVYAEKYSVAEKEVALPHTINTKRILYRAIQVEEPKLRFCGCSTNGFVYDENPMRGMKNNYPIDIEQYKLLANDITIGIIAPANSLPRVKSFLDSLNSNVNQQYQNADYVSDYIGFESIYNCHLDVPEVGSDRIMPVELNCNSRTTIAAICNRLKFLSEKYPGIVTVVYIPKEFEPIKKFDHNGEVFDFHDELI